MSNAILLEHNSKRSRAGVKNAIKLASLPEEITGVPDEGMIRLDVTQQGVNVPLMFSPLRSSPNLLVLFNGAVDRSRARDGVVFQRSSWREDFRANCLWVSDPTLTVASHLRLGWGQIHRRAILAELLRPIVNLVREQVIGNGASENSTLYYGSSAGGFQALMSAALDNGARAVVNNPQTNWAKYPIARDVEMVATSVLGVSNVSQLSEQDSWRVDVRQYFEAVGNFPRVRYFVNSDSEFDITDHYRPLQEWYSGRQGIAAAGFTGVEYVSGRQSGSAHNPMGRTDTIEAINLGFKM